MFNCDLYHMNSKIVVSAAPCALRDYLGASQGGSAVKTAAAVGCDFVGRLRVIASDNRIKAVTAGNYSVAGDDTTISLYSGVLRYTKKSRSPFEEGGALCSRRSARFSRRDGRC